MLSGEELKARGFSYHRAESLSMPTDPASASSSLPITFMVLDIIRSNARQRQGEQAEDGGYEEGGRSNSRKYRNRLVPIFTNKQCRSYFKISTNRDYVEVLKKLLKRDPLLTFALQKAVRHLKAGDSKSVSHVTPDPSGHTSSLIGMRITPCVWEQESRTFPALMFEHNVAYNPAVVMPRLMRDYAVLSHVPAILTLIDFQGKVLYQNASSLEYMGDLLSGKYDNQLTEGLLQVLYSCDLNSLEQMLDNVLRGQEWQGVVQVPYSMWRHLGHQQDPDTVIDFVEFTSTSFRQVLPGQESQASVGSGADSRHSNVGFLLNKQATAVGPTSDLVNFKRKSSTSRRNAAEASSFSFGLDSRQGSLTAAVAEVGGPNLQQRKFVALLNGAGGLSSAHMQGPSQSSSQRQLHMPSQVQPNMGSYGGSSTGSNPPGVEPDEDEEEEEEMDDDVECYHEIHAIPLLDPVLDKQVIMLVQTDVTPRVELENKLADLTDAQLSMLEELFPRHIIEYMLAREPSRGNRNLRGLANMHDKVMVLFCDVVGFTSMSKEVEAPMVMNFLNELYQTFDDLVEDYGMYKLDIVGDCYIVVAGLIKEDQDGFVCVDELNENEVASNAQRIMDFAKAMLRESRPVLMPHNNQPVSLRIGIHTGPLVSGLVGSKMPKFTLFGDTMNTASRMETTCRPGCVHVSETFANLIPYEQWESRGSIEVKGKGLMDTCLWVPRPEMVHSDLESGEPLERSLRQANSDASYTSNKGCITSFKSGASDQSSNPLMAILSNIRMDTSGFDDAASTISTTMRTTSNRRHLSSGASMARKDSRHKRSSDGHGSRILSEHPSMGSRASSNMLTIGAGPPSSIELEEGDTGYCHVGGLAAKPRRQA